MFFLQSFYIENIKKSIVYNENNQLIALSNKSQSKILINTNQKVQIMYQKVPFKKYLEMTKEQQDQENKKEQSFLQDQKKKLLEHIENDKKRLKLSDLKIRDDWNNDWSNLYHVWDSDEFFSSVYKGMHIHFRIGNVYSFNLTISYYSRTVFYMNDLKSDKDFKQSCDELVSQLYYDFSYVLGIQSLFFTIKKVWLDERIGENEDRFVLEISGYYAQTEWYEKSDKKRIETLDQYSLRLNRWGGSKCNVNAKEINYGEFQLKLEKEMLDWQVDKIYYFQYGLPDSSYFLYKVDYDTFQTLPPLCYTFYWLNNIAYSGASFVYFDSLNFTLDNYSPENIHSYFVTASKKSLVGDKEELVKFHNRIKDMNRIFPLKDINHKYFIQMYNIFFANNGLAMKNNNIYKIDKSNSYNQKIESYYCNIYTLYKDREKIQNEINKLYDKGYIDFSILDFSFLDLLKNRKYLIQFIENMEGKPCIEMYNMYFEYHKLRMYKNAIYKVDEYEVPQYYYCNFFTLYLKKKKIWADINKRYNEAAYKNHNKKTNGLLDKSFLDFSILDLYKNRGGLFKAKEVYPYK